MHAGCMLHVHCTCVRSKNMLHDLQRKEAEQCLIRRQLRFCCGLGSHNTPYKFSGRAFKLG